MLRGPLGLAVSTILPSLPVISLHHHAFVFSNCSALMPPTLRGNQTLDCLLAISALLKPQFPLAVLDYLRQWSDYKMVGFINQTLVSNVHLGSDSDIAQGC